MFSLISDIMLSFHLICELLSLYTSSHKDTGILLLKIQTHHNASNAFMYNKDTYKCNKLSKQEMIIEMLMTELL